MTIRDASELNHTRPQVDLTGPNGNAFVLLAMAKRWADDLGLNATSIQEEMKAGDYHNLIDVMEKYFGEYVDFYIGKS
jgi:hypothetical protein